MNNKATVTWTNTFKVLTSEPATDLICFGHYLKRVNDFQSLGQAYVALVQYDELPQDCLDCAMEVDV